MRISLSCSRNMIYKEKGAALCFQHWSPQPFFCVFLLAERTHKCRDPPVLSSPWLYNNI